MVCIVTVVCNNNNSNRTMVKVACSSNSNRMVVMVVCNNNSKWWVVLEEVCNSNNNNVLHKLKKKRNLKLHLIKKKLTSWMNFGRTKHLHLIRIYKSEKKVWFRRMIVEMKNVKCIVNQKDFEICYKVNLECRS